MKVTYLKLSNFIGIYSGTKKFDIEIDFSKGNNKIIMLLGENGSGKTTILSCLHPFRETNDKRKNIILPKKEGYKEIHYQNNNDVYIIKHFYSHTQSNKNKSYISKNNVEMNENGSIKLFEAYIKKEFGLDKDYFKIGRLGNNVQNFIDQTTSERKNYINKFVPNIDEYLESFDKVNEKVKNSNKKIDELKEEISSMNIDNLKNEEQTLEDSLNIKHSQEKKLLENIKEIDIKISSIDLDVDKDKLLNDFKNKKDEMDIDKRLIQNIYKEYDEVKNKNIEEVKTLISDLNVEMMNNFNSRNNIQKELNEIDVIINTKEGKIKNIKSNIKELKSNHNDDINDVKQRIKNNEKVITLSKEYIRNFSNDLNIDISNTNYINTLKNELVIFENLFNGFSNFRSDIIEKVTIKTNNSKKLDSIINKLNESKADLSDIEKDILVIESNKKLKEIYEKKPKDCKDTKCSFVSNAIDYVENKLPLLEKLLTKKDNLQTNIAKLEKSYDEESEIFNVVKYLKDIYNESKDLNIIKLYGFTIYDIKDNYVNEIQKIKEDFTKIDNVISKKENVKVLEMENEKDNSLLKFLELNEANLSKAERELEELKIEKNNFINKQKEYFSQLSKLIDEESFIKNKIKDYKDLLKLLENFNSLKEELINLQSIIQTNKDNFIKLENLTKENNSNKKELEIIQNNIKTISDKIVDVKTNIKFFNTYSERLKNIEENLNNLEIIKNALDPKKGIPLIFMKTFLTDISENANKLLDLVYNGDFKIDFKLNKKEFLIRVLDSKGGMLNDISEASQGEVSLTTISLSLSMIENLVKDSIYKIIYLDEIDSPLSTKNRRNFLDLLNRQLEGIDQVFIISHNEEFYSQDVDLILMKDHNMDLTNKEFLNGKTVLYNVYEN